ncbi:MAG: hypothetical protein ACT4OX_02740 [Actinomycetota bacterium]
MPATVRCTPWPDPVVDILGHDPRSLYAETFWLPTLGPTALLLLRHLADRFERQPNGVALPIADTAAALGLGPRQGENSPLLRTLARLVQFELAHRASPEAFAVRRALPPVHRRHVRRLPAALQARHAEWIADQTPNGPVDLARRRARRVALTLFAQGEPIDAVERALHTAGFHPALAHEGVRWAKARYQEITAADGAAAG